jgi:hypothetical protein
MQENEHSDGQANPDQVKKDILLKNQPNNRNLHVAFVAGCINILQRHVAEQFSIALVSVM